MCYKAVVTELPGRVDVAIIGAGFAGLATAWALRRRGVTNLIVLEREAELGRFASGRSAGLGRQLAEDDDTTRYTARGAELLRELPAWSHTGGVMSFDDAKAAENYAVRAVRFGIAAEPIDRAAVLARWPQLAELRVARALWVPSDGVIDVQKLLHEFADNIHVSYNTRVAHVSEGGVVTSRGPVAARVIVEAAGAWAGLLTSDEPLALYKRHVFVLERAANAGTPWIWHLGAGELYLRQVPDGIMVSPCDASRSEAGHQEPDLVGEEHLRKLLDDVSPELAGAFIMKRWACQRAFTENRKMRVGRDPDRPWLVWSAGLGGHGATASPAIGERAADAVIEALA